VDLGCEPLVVAPASYVEADPSRRPSDAVVARTTGRRRRIDEVMTGELIRSFAPR